MRTYIDLLESVSQDHLPIMSRAKSIARKIGVTVYPSYDGECVKVDPDCTTLTVAQFNQLVDEIAKVYPDSYADHMKCVIYVPVQQRMNEGIFGKKKANIPQAVEPEAKMNPNYPDHLGTFGNPNSYKHFSQNAMLKGIIEENGGQATVSLGPRPGTIRVSFGELTLIAEITSHEMKDK